MEHPRLLANERHRVSQRSRGVPTGVVLVQKRRRFDLQERGSSLDMQPSQKCLNIWIDLKPEWLFSCSNLRHVKTMVVLWACLAPYDAPLELSLNVQPSTRTLSRYDEYFSIHCITGLVKMQPWLNSTLLEILYSISNLTL
jgi:hypothetical protein